MLHSCQALHISRSATSICARLGTRKLLASQHTRRAVHATRAMIKVELSPAHVVVEVGRQVIADSKNSKILTEGSSQVYYIPPEDVRTDLLTKASNHTFCPFKGQASYYDAPGKPGFAWYYPDPKPEVAAIKDHVAFYNSRVDKATVDGAPARVSPY